MICADLSHEKDADGIDTAAGRRGISPFEKRWLSRSSADSARMGASNGRMATLRRSSPGRHGGQANIGNQPLGRRTLSTTWTMPFLAGTSARMTPRSVVCNR